MSSVRLLRLLLAVAVLVPTTVFVLAAWWNRAEILNDSRDTVARTAAIYDEHTGKVFEAVDLVVDRIQEHVKAMSWDEIALPKTSAMLRDIKVGLDHVISIWIADPDGTIRAGSLESWPEQAVWRDRAFFRQHRGADIGTYIGEATVGAATGLPSFGVSRRLTGPDGSFNGVIVVGLNPDYFSKFFRAAAPPVPNVAVLVRSDGAILARNPVSTDDRRFSADSPMMRRVTEGSGGAPDFMRSSIEDRELLVATRKIADYPLYVGVGIPKSVVLEAWAANLKLYGLVAIAAALTLLFVSWLAMRSARAEQDALARLHEETEQRLSAEQRLFSAQKMESIGQLTGGVAHDFNNLLAIILGNLNLLQRRVTDERSSRLVERAIRGAERGASLTQRLLAFARRQDLSPRNVDVPELVADMSNLMRRSLGPEVTIATDFPVNLPPAKIDPHQLELALLNLTVNARDAMPGGGKITITAREEIVPELVAGGMRPGFYVCISVADSGTGMDEETLARAVEPFFTTKGVGKGTGLGLSMVHGLAEQSGGTFKLQSRLGHGTTAEIWLPEGETEPKVAAAPAQAAPVPARHIRMLTVLVVDDDHLVASGTTDMLHDLGHVAFEVNSGAEALRTLGHRKVDIVLADQSMPAMTGTQLAQKIRAQWPNLPILLASGHAEIPERTALNLPRLTKPYRQQELADALAALTSSDDKPFIELAAILQRRRSDRPKDGFAAAASK